MTLIISHRGNLTGPMTAIGGENSLEAIETCMAKNFGVEIDVQYSSFLRNEILIGHDEIEYRIPLTHSIFYSEKLFLHAKNRNVLFGLFDIKKAHNYKFHIFYHESDPFTITDTGLIWIYPDTGYFLDVERHHAIDVLPELYNKKYEGQVDFYGICTDYPIEYALSLNERIVG